MHGTERKTILQILWHKEFAQYLPLHKKQNKEKDKKKGLNTGKTDKVDKPTTSRERREASEEKRKQDLSNYRKNNSSPITQHNSCVQVQMMENFLSGTHSDSDKDSYKTPPETLDTESEPEYDNDPNAPELSEDNLENDSEVEELLNKPENDTELDLHRLLSFPDI